MCRVKVLNLVRGKLTEICWYSIAIRNYTIRTIVLITEQKNVVLVRLVGIDKYNK